MARTLVLSLEGRPSSFGFARLERSKLYGTRKRLPLDPAGKPCKRAELSDDGAMLISAGMTAQGYFTEANDWVPSGDLVGLDADDRPVALQPCTIDEPQPLTEASPEALLDAAVTAVYMLDAVEFDEGLRAALNQGVIYRFACNMRADYHMSAGYLLGTDEAVFALIGETYNHQWCELEKPVVAADEDGDEDGDDLDFEMF